MSTDAYDVTVDIERNTPTDDLAGGTTEVWAAVYSAVACRRHLYGRTGWQLDREEREPGVMTARREFFLFSEKPFPTILTNDRIVVSGGATYLVHHVRTYQYTLQVDAEVVS